MTTITMETRLETAAPGRSLEELVDRLIDALFAGFAEQRGRTVAQAVHKARRLRQAGDLDGALASLAEVDTAEVQPHQTRWVYAEWRDLVRRRFGAQGVEVYSPGAGRAAALLPMGDGTLEVAAVLGMAWRVGKTVSRRSLRGLRPLGKARSEPAGWGGAAWS